MNNSEQHRRECEARYALSMDDTRRQAYYQGVKDKRGEKALGSLVEEVVRQSSLEAKKVLTMSDERRQIYYQRVSDERGESAAHALVTEVKRQRKLGRGLEM